MYLRWKRHQRKNGYQYAAYLVHTHREGKQVKQHIEAFLGNLPLVDSPVHVLTTQGNKQIGGDEYTNFLKRARQEIERATHRPSQPHHQMMALREQLYTQLKEQADTLRSGKALQKGRYRKRDQEPAVVP